MITETNKENTETEEVKMQFILDENKELNKIAVRWPTKTVAQRYFS